jgi:PAS domain S-box-containing protein
MNDLAKTKEQLIAELEAARSHITDLEEQFLAFPVKETSTPSYPVVIDYLISPVYVKDVNGKYLDCNKLFEDFLQLSRDKIIGKASYDIIPNERAQKHEEMDNLLYQNGGILSYECEINRRNGEVIVVWFRKTLFSDSFGAPGGIIGEIIDITERKKSEQALIVREQELRTLVENIPDIIIRYDSDLRRIYVNPAWEKASGLSAKDVINHPFSRPSQVPNTWYEEYVQKLQSILSTGTPKTIEFTWINTQGETLFLEYTLLPEYDRTGKISGVLVVGHDLTERKQAEELLRKTGNALTESCNKLTLAMDLAKLVQWECDLATRTFFFDNQFYALYGTSAAREGGHLMSAETYAREFVHPDEVNIVAEECDRALHSKEENYFGQVEHRIIRRDGEIRHIVVRYFLVRDTNGRPVKTIGANQDITERIHTQEALKRARQELELRVEQRTKELRIANERLLELDQRECPENCVNAPG